MITISLHLLCGSEKAIESCQTSAKRNRTAPQALHNILAERNRSIMKFSGFVLSLLTLQVVQGNNSDLFNYGSVDITENGVTSFGQENWGDVSCSDFDSCVSISTG